MESRCQYQRESYSIAHWRRNNIRKQYESYKAHWDGCPCVANSLASLCPNHPFGNGKGRVGKGSWQCNGQSLQST